MNNNYILKVKNIYTAYENKLSLKDVFFTLPENVIAAIVGPNGAGKTTLLENILKLQKPLFGDIYFKKDLDLKKNIAYVPQKKSVDWNFPISVKEVVAMAFLNQYGVKDKALKIERALEKVDLLHLKDRLINELSGGEQQRMFIARALAKDALLYIMDEPFAGIDKKTETMIAALFKELQQQGKTLLVVHHDWNTVHAYFDWVVFLNKTIIYNGSLKECNFDDNINKTFV